MIQMQACIISSKDRWRLNEKGDVRDRCIL
jgi:hypothetical protein